MPTPDEVARGLGEEPSMRPGAIVLHDDERRVVVDVIDEDDPLAVLRYPDGDPRREVDADGGDVHLEAVTIAALVVLGHI